MILIADSGSTKTDWRAFSADADTIIAGKSKGLNPYFVDVETVAQEAAQAIDENYHNAIKVIYFYGSGCSSPKAKRIIKEGLQMVFPYAQLYVEHDLLAAARALCGREPGVACIVGTGANACRYDGQQIVQEAVSFGYVMGDEGAGSHLGKLFLKALLNGRLSASVEQAFYQRHPSFDLEYLLHRLYRAEAPNKYLASFAPFVAEYQDDEQVRALVKQAFNAFLDEFVMGLKDSTASSLPIHFQGSIAWHFKAVLQAVLAARHLPCGSILKYPVDALLDYHRG